MLDEERRTRSDVFIQQAKAGVVISLPPRKPPNSSGTTTAGDDPGEWNIEWPDHIITVGSFPPMTRKEAEALMDQTVHRFGIINPHKGENLSMAEPDPDWASAAAEALREAIPGATIVLRSEDAIDGPPLPSTPKPCRHRCLPEGGVKRFQALVKWLREEGVSADRAAEVARDMVLAGEA